MKGAHALAISATIKPMLAGHGREIQGGVLVDLVSTWLAGHHPDIREKVLTVFIEIIRELVPVNEAEIFPDGLPADWRPQ